MKNLLFLLLSITFCGCFTDNFYDSNNINENEANSIESQISNRQKIKIKAAFKHRGPLNGFCDDGSDCGRCLGICVIITWTLTDSITTAERADGYGLSDIEILQGNKMSFIPDSSIDNGAGYAIVDTDNSVGLGVSTELGYSNVVVKAGTYAIDYSTYSDGEVKLDVVSTP